MQSSPSSTQSRGDDFVASLSLQRQRLLSHAGSLLGASSEEVAAAGPAASKLAQALVSALEIIKVAEEEVLDERRRHAMLEEMQGRQLAHFRAMFDLAPTPLLLTTTDTTIREANSGAAKLLGLEPTSLEGRQLWSMVVKNQHAAFREQLGHVIEIGRVAAWSFTLDVQRNLPVVISATVDIIDDPAVGARAMYWNLRPVAV